MLFSKLTFIFSYQWHITNYKFYYGQWFITGFYYNLFNYTQSAIISISPSKFWISSTTLWPNLNDHIAALRIILYYKQPNHHATSDDDLKGVMIKRAMTKPYEYVFCIIILSFFWKTNWETPGISIYIYIVCSLLSVCPKCSKYWCSCVIAERKPFTILDWM